MNPAPCLLPRPRPPRPPGAPPWGCVSWGSTVGGDQIDLVGFGCRACECLAGGFVLRLVRNGEIGRTVFLDNRQDAVAGGGEGFEGVGA